MVKISNRALQFISLGFFVSFIITLFYCVFFVASEKQAVGSDVVSFLTGALVIRNGEQKNIYDFLSQLSFQQQLIRPYEDVGLLPFRNLPVFAAVFIPLTYISLQQAYKFYLGILILVLVYVSYLSKKNFGNSIKFPFWSLLPFIFIPNLAALFNGQFALWVLLILLLIHKFIKSENYFWAGAISSLLFVKLQYIIAIPFIFFLIPKKKGYLTGFLTCSFIVILLSILISGPKTLVGYLPFLVRTESAAFGSRPWQMYTFFSVLKYLPAISKLSSTLLLTINTAFYLLVLGFFARIARKIPFDKAFASAVLFSVAFSVHALNHDLSVVMVPIFIFLNIFFGRGRQRVKFSSLLIAIIFFILPLFSFLRIAPLASIAFLFIGLYLLKPVIPFSPTSD